jgi:uncharacterized protein
MRSVCIAGGNGFIGRNLAHHLKNEGYSIIFITRGDFENEELQDKVRNSSIIINLVGESIAGFWTKKKRNRIYESRVLSSRKLVRAVNEAGNEVRLFLQVSGVAIYDDQNMHTEESNLHDTGFLSQVIRDWEGELDNIARNDLRIVILRMGIVLDKSGGFLKQILFPLKVGIGFGVRSNEFFPFILLEDLMNVFIFCIRKESINGIVNVTAPALTKINHFFHQVVRINNGRIILWFNTAFIRFVMGESGSLLTKGQQVIPQKLKDEGFLFNGDNIENALNRACN